MDKTFQAVVATYKVAPKLSHKQEIMRLYRRFDQKIVTNWKPS